MTTRSGITVLCIHGIPRASEHGQDPCNQLNLIKNAVSSQFPVLQSALENCRWAKGTERERVKFVLTARKGRFSLPRSTATDPPTFYDLVAECLEQTASSSTGLIVIAYSGGGILFYRWLATRTKVTEGDNNILAAFVIASLYQCKKKYIEFEGRRFPFLDPPIERELIVRNLEPSKLHVILAGNDPTIRYEDAEFEDLDACKIVRQHVVKDATHDTICDEDETIQYILEHMEEILSS